MCYGEFTLRKLSGLRKLSRNFTNERSIFFKKKKISNAFSRLVQAGLPKYLLHILHIHH